MDSSSILDTFKAQLQQDLNRLIENHEQEMKSERERMKIERDALTAQYQAELDELRSKHQKEILEAEETQKKKLDSIREVLKLEVNALANINNGDDQNDGANADSTNNDNDNDDNADDNGLDLNSDEKIDQEIIKKFKELDGIDQEMTNLPQTSRDPQDFQKLLLINKKQYRLLRDIASCMKKKVITNTQELNSQLININEAYHKQFSQYEWFHNKQKALQDLGKIEQKSSV